MNFYLKTFFLEHMIHMCIGSVSDGAVKGYEV